MTVENCIVSHNRHGEGIYCDDGSSASVTCTDVFSNEGGDWVGCLEGQEGENGNLSVDPLFCDASLGDYGLSQESPCAPPNGSCGLIGARPVSCGSTRLEETTWGRLKARYFE